MKMNSRHRSPSWRRFVAILVCAICGFILLSYFRSGVGTGASLIFSPVVSIKTWFTESSARLPSYLRMRATLINTIESLEEEVQERESDAITIRQLQAENDELRTALNLRKDARITAQVLVRPNQTPYDSVLIDHGTADGVVDGAIVYVNGNIAIGRILQTYAHSSLVQLVSSPRVVTTAYVDGPDIFTQTEGMGGGVLRVAVPQGIPLAVGNLVVLPATGSGVYGEIVSIEGAASDPQQYGYVTTAVALQHMRFVDVAVSAPPTISYEEALRVIQPATTTPFTITVPEEVLVGTTTATTSTTRE